MKTRPKKVVVIGDGIIGSTTAYELARAGHQVEVVSDSAADNASHGNAGILALSYAMPMSSPKSVFNGMRSLLGIGHDVQITRPLSAATLAWFAQFAFASRPFKAARTAKYINQLARQSLQTYKAIAQREDFDLGFRATGWLYAARTPKALRQQQKAASALEPLGITHETLGQQRLFEQAPGLGQDHIGAVRYHDDIAIDPGHLVTCIQNAASRHGVKFHSDHVISYQQRASGEVAEVATQQGRSYAADHFVIATGAYSRKTARMFNERLAVEPGTGWNMVFPPSSKIASDLLMSVEDHIIVNASSSSVRVTGGMRFGGQAGKVPSSAQIRDLRRAAERLVPAIAEYPEPLSTWQGARPMTPDGKPIVTWLSANLLAVTGHGTLGMTLAPATAEHARELLETRM